MNLERAVLPMHDARAGVTALVGTRMGRYELRGLLGVGGMGAVYEARDDELDRAVALKVLRPELTDTAGFADRLIRESRLMAKVAHPSVIAVYDIGRDGEVVFIAMELIVGPTLTAWLAAHELDWRGIAALFERAGRGLAAAHGAGIIHRDFKPDNVLVALGGTKVVVTDFGIAREVEPHALDSVAAPYAPIGDPRRTADSAVLGTPAYMAPEQIAGDRVDHRADVFAFSASLWEAVFRQRPFGGKTTTEIYAAMRATRLRPPPGARRVPRRLLRALRKGLAIDPRERWVDMPAMLAELAVIRTARRRFAIAAGAASLVGVGLTAALLVDRPAPLIDRCTRALATLTEAYNPARAAQVGAALTGAPAIQRTVLARFSETADAWRTTERATCHPERDVAQDAQITACLDARRLELAGSVDDVIAGGAAGAKYAARISDEPGPPAACATPSPGLLFTRVPASPALQREVTALRNRIADVNEASVRGEAKQVLPEIEQVVAAATVWPPLDAEARYALGLTQRRAGNRKLATVTLRDAAGAAERAHHDEVAAHSWIMLAFAATFDEGDPPRGIEYITYAEAAADRVGRPPSVMMRLEYTKGVVLVTVNRSDEAEVALRRAIELAEPIGGEELGRATQGLALLYEDLGRYPEAVASYRQALEQARRATPGPTGLPPMYFERLGLMLAAIGQPKQAEIEGRHAAQIADGTLAETHSVRAFVHISLSRILLDAGHPDEALAEASAGAAAIARIQGPRSERYGEGMTTHGEILYYLGRHREAEPLLARACDVIAFTAADDDMQYAQCESLHARALVAMRRPAEALPRFDRAIDSLIKSHGEAHPWVAEALIGRATAHAALGQRAPAIAEFERAIALLSPKTLDPGFLAAARAGLARALWTDDPARARAEATAATTLFETANARWAVERAALATWLARRAP